MSAATFGGFGADVVDGAYLCLLTTLCINQLATFALHLWVSFCLSIAVPKLALYQRFFTNLTDIEASLLKRFRCLLSAPNSLKSRVNAVLLTSHLHMPCASL